ncbi:hypothetical protein BKA70DRAFT_1215065 [Coprinopsis sp. MPI-PUGE-AT-0042]|nr:hypothetical protein BKA70DRAFT_1215065 [Coprinopsis sp. MPI-PUGE-AT-0042]
MPHTPTKTSSRRRSGRQHRLPIISSVIHLPTHSVARPLVERSPRGVCVPHLSSQEACWLFPQSTTPIKVKLERLPRWQSIFQPLEEDAHWNIADPRRRRADGVGSTPVAPASQRQAAEFSTPGGFSPAQYSTNRSSPAGDESSEILDGIGQNPYQLEQSVSSPVRPVWRSSSDFDEIRALDLPKSFFRENRIKGFDPRLPTKSNIGALCDFGSRYPVGVNTLTFLKLFVNALSALMWPTSTTATSTLAQSTARGQDPLPTEDASFITYMTEGRVQGCYGGPTALLICALLYL